MKYFSILLTGLLCSAFSCRETCPDFVSPSGNFTASLMVTEGSEGYGIWQVMITSGEDEVQLLELMNRYPGSLMAYIAWDEEERLWFYSSDDGCYYYWQNEAGEWKKHSWSIASSSELTPPSSLVEQMNRSRRN